MMMTVCTQPTEPVVGLREAVLGFPFESYRVWPGVNAGLLNALARSPAHAKALLDYGRKDTPALALGRNMHSACLQPDEWRAKKAVAPDCGRRTKGRRDIWADFISRSAGKDVVSEEDDKTIEEMIGSCWRHEGARELLRSDGGIEVSLRWRDPETDLPCKARLDKISQTSLLETGVVIADLKTTEHAGYRPFMSAALKYGYHRQAAWYWRAARIVLDLPESTPFALIAVEKSRPWATSVYVIDPDTLRMLDKLNQKLLRTWAGCVKTGDYPAYHKLYAPLILPEWAIHADDDDREPITLGGEEIT